MAERLPVGTTRDIKSPSFTSFGSGVSSIDVLLNASVDRPNGQTTPYKEADLNGSNTPSVLNGSIRNGNRSKDGEDEWVEQDEPGVYITLTSLPGGIIDLKRVRFRYVSKILICYSFPFPQV